MMVISVSETDFRVAVVVFPEVEVQVVSSGVALLLKEMNLAPPAP